MSKATEQSDLVKCWRPRCRRTATLLLVVGAWPTTSCAVHAGEVLERKASYGPVQVTLWCGKETPCTPS